MTIQLSIIIPLYNEEESLKELHERIQKEIEEHDLGPYEIMFINDGSTDNSLEILEGLQKQDPNIRIINFSRNYKKAAALATGFRLSRGEYVITMDADLQDDPKEIHNFIQMSRDKNLDMISGWKKVRHDPLEKRLPSKLFNLTTSGVGGIRLHDFNCGFKLYRRKVVKSIYHLIYGEMHRFIPLLAHWGGFSVGEMVVEHHSRKYGYSKYGFARYFHGYLDLLTLFFLNRFHTRPMHIFGSLGTITALIGFGIEFYMLYVWILSESFHVRPLMLLGIFLIMVSLQFFSLGFISEMINQKGARQMEYNYEELSPPTSEPTV